MFYTGKQNEVKVHQGDIVRVRGDWQSPAATVISYDPAWQTVKLRVGLNVDVQLIEKVELLYPAKSAANS